MNLNRNILLGYLILCFSQFLYSQKKKAADYVAVNGYIKGLSTFNFVKDETTFNATLLLHNRINLLIKPVNRLTVGIGMRNRIFITNQEKFIPEYGKLLGKDDGLVDVSFTLLDRAPLIIHTMFDRMYIDWQADKWNIRVGRQRLNWGMNLTWNPNDIFNTYNFLDFDYEERPGTDAVKFQYHFTPFSNLELAVSPSRDKYSIVGSAKYALNKRSYDFQFLAGNYKRDIFLGFGWAGNIRNAGFKGEISYFQDWQDRKFKHVAVCGSTTFDYAFKKGWYIAGSFLYNNTASDNFLDALQLFSYGKRSPKLLMPAKYNFLFQTSKQFSPVGTGQLTLVYAPIMNLFIVNPSCSFSLSNSWDLDFIVQCYFGNDLNKKFNVLGNSFNMRARWSFSN